MHSTPSPPPLNLPELFPLAFDPAQPRPLKRGIRGDLQRVLNRGGSGSGPSGQALVRALALWCERPAYLRALVPGAARIGLDGQPCGEIVKSREAKVAARQLDHPLSLLTLYPAAFDPLRRRPLKVGIHEDLIAAGHDPAAVRYALLRYTQSPLYRRHLVAGALRIGLDGQPAGTVAATWEPAAVPALAWPRDVPVKLEDTVTGRLELTLKFTALPKPALVQGGYKIGIRTDTALVVATLKPKVWRKLEQAQAAWPQWVAVLTGRLGDPLLGPDGPVLPLEQPALQVFEKPPKPAPAPGAA